jgi:hypothetical protein
MIEHPQPQTATGQKPVLHTVIAILAGQLFVNLPVILVILVITFFGLALTRDLARNNTYFLELANSLGLMSSIIIGAWTGWLWWSFSFPRWRAWACRNGAPVDRLQKWTVLTGLEWPKGFLSEKSE